MIVCTPEFERLASTLGGVQCDGNAFVTLSNPFTLANWTLPVIEVLLIAGAIAGVVHALRWRRHTGDSSNLIVWIASVFCLLIIEPFAYFPQWFGLQDLLGLTFVHNQFSVQFFYNRLPLYIIAMYPAFGYLSYVLVQRTGILRRNPLIGAAAVAFTFHCLYEVIDTVGPQWRWWAWNRDLATSKPALGAVPYVNLQAFSIALPFAIALITLLVTRHSRGISVFGGVIAVCILVWPVLFLSSLPSFVIDLFGATTNTARLWATWGLIAVSGVMCAAAFITSLRTDVDDGPPRDRFALACSITYLIVATAIWGAALPDYLRASDGVTADGAPVGSLTYGMVTWILSVALIVAAHVGGRPRRRPTNDDVGTSRVENDEGLIR